MIGQLTILSGRDGVLLPGQVLRKFDILPAKCPHDIMADYMLRVSVDQRKYVASKCHGIAYL